MIAQNGRNEKSSNPVGGPVTADSANHPVVLLLMGINSAEHRHRLACDLIPRHAPELVKWYQQRYGSPLTTTLAPFASLINVTVQRYVKPANDQRPALKSLQPKSPDEVQAAVIRYRRAFQGNDIALFHQNALCIVRTYQPNNAALETWLNNFTGVQPAAATSAIGVRASPTPEYAIAIDPELARLAIAMKFDTPLCLWSVFRDTAKGRGWIYLKHTARLLRDHHVKVDHRTRRNAIDEGEGVFWNIDRSTGKLYLKSYEKLARKLTGIAVKTVPDAVATNSPGRRPVYIPVRGDVTGFKAQCYAAWLGSDENRQGISRFTLCHLWRVTAPTLRLWESRAGIARKEAIAQYAGNDPALPPDHSYPYVTADGQPRKAWRISNHYQPPTFIEKSTGNIRVHRVYALCRNTVEFSPEDKQDLACSDYGAADNASGDIGTGLHLSTFGRIFFTSGEGSYKARKRALNHLKRYEDWQRPHYARLTTKHRNRTDFLIYDAVAPDAQTTPYERFTLRIPVKRQDRRRYA